MNEFMRNGLYLFILFFTACTLPEEKDASVLGKQDSSIMHSDASYTAETTSPADVPILPAQKKIKKPQGIYTTILPFNGKMEQTVAFYNDLTYQLQEKYNTGKNDSIVVSQGNWAPSDGYIWLYKDQVVRARYTWKGDTLQYYNPLMKKNFAMQRQKDVLENEVWKNRKHQGIMVMGIGNEPFWSIEISRQDSLSLLLPEWTKPLTMKIISTNSTADSTAYIAQNDSAELKLTVLPFFCRDGMSDFVYSNKVKMQYNNQVFNGCGVVFK